MFAQLTAWINGVQPNLNWTNRYPLTLTQECSIATVAGTKNVKAQRGRQKTKPTMILTKFWGKAKLNTNPIQFHRNIAPRSHTPNGSPNAV